MKSKNKQKKIVDYPSMEEISVWLEIALLKNENKLLKEKIIKIQDKIMQLNKIFINEEDNIDIDINTILNKDNIDVA